MTKDEAINKGIDLIKGQPLFVGHVCAHQSFVEAMTLLRYEGNLAVCDTTEGIKRFPRSEIFDPNKLINVANHLINLGFWREGMESVTLHIK